MTTVQEHGNRKDQALNELSSRYNLLFTHPQLVQELAFIAETQKVETYEDFYLRLTKKPIERMLKLAVPDAQQIYMLLTDILSLIDNGYYQVHRASTTQLPQEPLGSAITWGTEVLADRPAVMNPGIRWGDQDMGSPVTSPEPAVAAVQAQERNNIGAAAEVLMRMHELLKNLHSDSVQQIITQCKPLLERLLAEERKFPGMAEGQLSKLRQAVTHLKNSVITFRQDNSSSPHDMLLHDALQTPLFGLEQRLQYVIEGRQVRDVRSKIKLG